MKKLNDWYIWFVLMFFNARIRGYLLACMLIILILLVASGSHTGSG